MQRLKTIENSIFKSKETNTIFDDFETKFLHFEVAMHQSIDKVQTRVFSKITEVEDRLFETNNRIS